MTRLGYLLTCAILGSGAALLACGTSTPNNTNTATNTKTDTNTKTGSTTSKTETATDTKTNTNTNTDTKTSTSTAVATLESLVPLDSEVPGWKIDPSNALTADKKPAAIATTKKGTEALVDGSAEDFWGEVSVDKVPKRFAWQVYVNAKLASSTNRPNDGSVIQLYLFEMPSEAAAAGLYAWLVKDKQYALYDPQAGWTEPTTPLVGAKSRVVNDNGQWWINFYKGKFYGEVQLSPSYGPAPDLKEGDQGQKDAMFEFASHVASKM